MKKSRSRNQNHVSEKKKKMKKQQKQKLESSCDTLNSICVMCAGATVPGTLPRRVSVLSIFRRELLL